MFFITAWLYTKLLHIEGKELRSSIEAGAWRITPLKRITCDEHQVVARSRWSDDGISSLAVGRYVCRACSSACLSLGRGSCPLLPDVE